MRHKFKCGNETHSEIAEEIKLMMGIKGHVLVMCMQIIKISSLFLQLFEDLQKNMKLS